MRQGYLTESLHPSPPIDIDTGADVAIIMCADVVCILAVDVVEAGPICMFILTAQYPTKGIILYRCCL